MSERVLVRAHREFSSSVDGELTLSIGAIVQVHRQIDRYWLYGCRTDGQFGTFPANNVVDIHLPIFDMEDDREQIYVAKANFKGQEDGDLPFRKGDLIVGEAIVDNNWHRGRCNGQFGIFPLNLVWPADMKLILKSKASKNNVVNLRAKVKIDLKAQLEDEIDLSEGDVVKITEVVDKDWYRGECNGKTGIFPSAFVVVLDNGDLPDLLSSVSECKKSSTPLTPSIITTTPTVKNNSKFIEEFGSKNHTDPHAKTIYKFKGEFPNELSFETGRTVRLLRRVDSHWLEGELNGRVGLFPLCYVDVVIDLPMEPDVDRHLCEATILYDFQAQLDGDVSVSEGEIVNIVDTLDSGWSRVRKSNGNIGLCPTSYVKSMKQLVPNSLPTGNMFHRQMSLPTTSFSGRESYDGNLNVPPKVRHELNGRLYDNFEAMHLTTKPEDNVRSRSVPPPRPPPLKPAVDKFPIMDVGLTSLRIPHRPAPPVPLQRRRPQSVAAIYINSSGEQHKCRPLSINMSELEISRTSNSSESDGWFDAASSVGDEGLNLRQRNQENNRTPTMAAAVARSNSSSPVTAIATAEDRAEKNNRKRQLILAELLQTERTYLQDLQFCHNTFMSDTHVANSKGVDVQFLFGTIDRLLPISQKLLSLLEQATTPSEEAPSEGAITVGFCFKQVASDMKDVYSNYCTRHEEVLALLDKYEENPEISGYFREKLESGPSSAHYFNMGSVLIKPVQRIMKYPLLLNELVKVTGDNDASKKDLVAAIALMTDVASAINECKRKKDLVMKYRKETDEGQATKLAKLNLHSVVKKSQRIGMRLSSSLGLVSLTKDMAFDEEENKFRIVERTARLFARNCETFCTDLQDCIAQQFKLAEHIGDFYAERRNQPEVDHFRTVQRTIVGTIWTDFKSAVNSRVTVPLSELLHTFDGPNRLIEKRNDKLLDYDRASAKIEKNKDINRSGLLREELQLAKNTYEALNSQLLEELPKLTSLAGLVLKDCISSFVFARKRFVGRVTQITLPLMELPQLASCSGDILDAFEEKHAEVIDKMAKISLIPREFQHSPRPERSSGRFGTIERLKKSATLKPAASGQQTTTPTIELSAPDQSSSQKAYLQGRYPPETLFVTVQRYQPLDALELSLKANDLVAVVKSQDPMGRTDRWFVDDGVRKGFVPAKFLAPTAQSSRILSTSSPSPTPPPQIGSSTTSTIQGYGKSCNNRYDEVCIEDATEFNGHGTTHQNNHQSVNDRYDLPCEIGDFESEGTVSPDNVSLYENLEPTTLIAHGSSYSPILPNTSPACPEYFYATYDFGSTGPNELSLARGQVVLVRHRHDLDGNPDWWFVEDRYGNQGYAPCNYLAECASVESANTSP